MATADVLLARPEVDHAADRCYQGAPHVRDARREAEVDMAVEAEAEMEMEPGKEAPAEHESYVNLVRTKLSEVGPFEALLFFFRQHNSGLFIF